MRVRLAVAAALILPSIALGAIYEVRLDEVDDEQDIIDLEERGDISTETADILYEMIVEGVDLNTATRDELYDLPGLTYADADAILQYRKDKGRIEDPTELVGAGSLTDQQLLLIAPFIKLDSGPVRLPVAGKLRLRTGFSNGDFSLPTGALPPPAFLTGAFALPANFSAGFVVNTTRLEPGTVYYDGARGALAVDRFAYRASLPTAYVQWKASQRRVVVGSFTIGFAERLTLDNTRRKTPNGISVTSVITAARDLASYCKQSGTDVCNGTTNSYVLDDWTVRTNFRGVAGSIEDLEFGDNRKLSLFGFLSYQSRNLYQYETYDTEKCTDPRAADNVLACKSPQVFVGSDLSSDGRLKFTTLPSLYDELVAGAHVDFKPSDRYRIGLTGYAANNFWGVPSRAPYWHESFSSHFADSAPIRLQPQEWSRSPWGGPFGAVGLDFKAQLGQFGLFLEAARSFDSIPVGPDPATQPAGGGGFGIEQRTLFNPRRHEVELSLRFYDDKFLNPLARPIAAPDEFEGQTARNEAGARLRYFGKLPYDFELRARADFWVLPFTTTQGPRGTASLYSLLRVDYEGYRVVAPAIWFDMRNVNLASSKHGACAAGTIFIDTSEPYTCSGDSYRVGARVDIRPLGRKLSGSVQAAYTLKDDIRYKDSFRQDVSAALEVRSMPTDFLQLKVRTRYLNEDTADNTYQEHSLWSYVQATYIHGRNFRFSLRYDLNVFLDQRASYLTRVPKPEHRVYLDLRAGF